jgi:uncharacterized protein YdiU (UPF0061 family)
MLNGGHMNQQANSTKSSAQPVFIPSSWMLEQMIAAAMAKCDRAVAEHRFNQAVKHNARVIRESREHNFARRYINAGDRP